MTAGRPLARVVRRLRGDARGATIVEFAIITPVMLTLIMGLGELAYQGYMQSMLTGAIQKAGRDSTIQGASTQTTQIDAKVVAQLTQLRTGWTVDCSGSPPANKPTYCSTRKSYSSFLNVGPEPYVDANHNNQYDVATECFTDINGNGTWDADQGAGGSQGGASDVAVYTLKIQYPHLFPVAAMLGWSRYQVMSSTTILKNQPYTTQAASSPKTCCPGAGCS